MLRWYKYAETELESSQLHDSSLMIVDLKPRIQRSRKRKIKKYASCSCKCKENERGRREKELNSDFNQILNFNSIKIVQ